MKKFRTKYDSRRVSKSFKGVKGLADPQYLKDTTIDGIIRRYGVLPASDVKPIGGDVSEYGDFAKCMQRVQDGVDSFMAMPSEMRARFGNDPRAFYDWISNPMNVPEAVKLGLMVERKEEKSTSELLKEIADNTRVTPTGATES